MGLDMYLYRKTFVSKYFNTKLKITIEGDPSIKPERIRYITEEVAYWRKANQIHGWFVRHVQGGVDECQESRVSRDQLQELVTLCKRLLAEKDVARAEKELPTQPGFFFGDTEYGPYYWEDLQQTIDMLEPLLTDEDAKDFTYRSSW